MKLDERNCCFHQVFDEHNLKVTHYQNGDTIRLAQSNIDWYYAGRDREGAYCIVEETGGYLYNWYAVADPRGLAPKGWKVPTIHDLAMVEDSDSLRVYDGLRSPDGYFGDQFYGAFLWSSSDEIEDYAWHWYLYDLRFGLMETACNKGAGFSVRCIKEEE